MAAQIQAYIGGRGALRGTMAEDWKGVVDIFRHRTWLVDSSEEGVAMRLS